MRSFSTERDLRENSLEYEDEEGISTKATVNLPSHIICHIKRKLTSPKTSEQKQHQEVCLANSYNSHTTSPEDTFVLPTLRARSNTFSVANNYNKNKPNSITLGGTL